MAGHDAQLFGQYVPFRYGRPRVRPVDDGRGPTAPSRPSRYARPSMMSMLRLQVPPDNLPAGFELREDLRLELVEAGRLVEPRIGEKARLHASLREEFLRAPGPFHGDLRAGGCGRGGPGGGAC